MTDFALKDTLVFLEHSFNKGVLADSRWTDDDDGFAFEGRWVERTEILFCKDEDVILKRKIDNGYLISKEEFMKKAEAGDFVEYREIGGHMYGTCKKEL